MRIVYILSLYQIRRGATHVVPPDRDMQNKICEWGSVLYIQQNRFSSGGSTAK
jgi:hypothetical protein